MFSRVQKKWGYCGVRLVSAGKNFCLKARMLEYLSLNRFGTGVGLILAFDILSSLHLVASCVEW